MKKIKQAHWWAIVNAEKWETANPNWRPRKGISLVNKELADAGFVPATKQDIETNYMSMLQLSQADLTEIWNNKDKPMLIRILAKNMLGGKGFDIIEKMLDRGIGKAMQREEISGDVKFTKVIIWLPEEEIEE